MITNIILIIAFGIAIWFSILLIGKLILKNSVPAYQIFLLAVSLTVIITHYVGLW